MWSCGAPPLVVNGWCPCARAQVPLWIIRPCVYDKPYWALWWLCCALVSAINQRLPLPPFRSFSSLPLFYLWIVLYFTGFLMSNSFFNYQKRKKQTNGVSAVAEGWWGRAVLDGWRGPCRLTHGWQRRVRYERAGWSVLVHRWMAMD